MITLTHLIISRLTASYRTVWLGPLSHLPTKFQLNITHEPFKTRWLDRTLREFRSDPGCALLGLGSPASPPSINFLRSSIQKLLTTVPFGYLSVRPDVYCEGKTHPPTNIINSASDTGFPAENLLTMPMSRKFTVLRLINMHDIIADLQATVSKFYILIFFSGGLTGTLGYTVNASLFSCAAAPVN